MPIITVKPEVRDLLISYIQKFPYLSNLKLSRLINADKHLLNYSIGSLRQMISTVRYESNIPAVEVEDIAIPPADKVECPDTLYDDYLPYEIPHIPIFANKGEVLIISDIHIPFHDKNALETMVYYSKQRKIDSIIINGDLIDFYGLSRFHRLPKLRNVKREIELSKQFLDYLIYHFPHSRIFYKIGNHEERWEHHLQSDANRDISDIDEFRLDFLLDGDGKKNIKFIKDKQLIKIGKLYIMHGHEIFAGAGTVNVARTVRLKANENVLFGHFHKSQDDYQRTVSGSVIGSWSVGCLCGLNPLYLPINNWNHGFAIVNFDGEGFFHIDNKKIIGNKVL